MPCCHQAKTLPIYGNQFHPEKIQFVHSSVDKDVPRTPEAVAGARYLAKFFAAEAGKSNHTGRLLLEGPADRRVRLGRRVRLRSTRLGCQQPPHRPPWLWHWLRESRCSSVSACPASRAQWSARPPPACRPR